jgi:hypothetical protein
VGAMASSIVFSQMKCSALRALGGMRGNSAVASITVGLLSETHGLLRPGA